MTSQKPQPILFVNWQDEESRKIFPVGRLRTLEDGGYEYVYIQAAREAQEHGFVPFQAFPHLERVYRSHDLPAFFHNRVLQPGRPDYPQYLRELGLSSPTATPVEILARSGGRRVTDPLEIFAEFVPSEGRLEGYFFARGIRHRPGAEEAVKGLNRGDQLRLQPDPTNAFNLKAQMLLCHDGEVVGYVPDYLADDVVLLKTIDPTLGVDVVQVNLSPSPSQQRLLCRMSISETSPPPHRGPRFESLVRAQAEKDVPGDKSRSTAARAW